MSKFNVNIAVQLDCITKTIFKRFNSTTAQKLFYKEYGDPIKVVSLETSEFREPKPEEVVVKLLAAPVNPADINTIQGKYPIKPKLPAVPGIEGVGKIIKRGSIVKDLAEGDHVILLSSILGSWQTHLTASQEKFFKVPKELGIVEAATLTVNPSTAYRMLKSFTELKPKDTIIQNGANSAVGQNVIQICHAWEINTVNVVRDRPDINELKQYLKTLGATYVLTEEELSKTDIFKSEKVEKPKLLLNCVGGENALQCIRHLEKGGTMVTYGGMSMKPLLIPTSALIFKDLKIRGFWMTKWYNEIATNDDKFKMFSELISMMTSGKIQAPIHKMVDFKNYIEALSNTLSKKGMVGKKYILNFEI